MITVTVVFTVEEQHLGDTTNDEHFYSFKQQLHQDLIHCALNSDSGLVLDEYTININQ